MTIYIVPFILEVLIGADTDSSDSILLLFSDSLFNEVMWVVRTANL